MSVDSNYTVISTTDNFTQLVNKTNTISKEVGGLARLTTTIDSDLVGAINELDSDIGTRPHTTLTTSANKDCLGRFFNEQSESISTWENNCLNMGSL